MSYQVAPLVETVDKEWNRISLTAATDGTITSHTGKLTLFGLEKEVRELVPQPEVQQHSSATNCDLMAPS